MLRIRVTTEYLYFYELPIRISQLLEDSLRYWSRQKEQQMRFGKGSYHAEYPFVVLYDRANVRCPTGFLPRVKMILEREGVDYEIDKKLPETTTNGKTGSFRDVSLRPYQSTAIEKALSHKRGIIQAPTGSGKTRICFDVLSQAPGSRSVILVPNKVLLNQTYKRLQETFKGIDILKWGDNSTDTNEAHRDAYILVSTVQSAWTRAESPFLTEANAVFVDESHHMAADTFHTVTRTCQNARYLIGLSATPYRDDGADLELEAWLGPKIFSISYDELIDQGYLVPPEFHFVNSLEEVYPLIEGKKAIFFSEKIKELEDARHVFESHGTPILTSKNGSRSISEHLLRLERGDVGSLAATPIFDEGLDMPNLDCVVFFACGRSRVRTIQRVGRAMRPYPGKTKCLVVDIKDATFGSRLAAYMSEPAFKSRLPKR